ncbi:MAG: response regulator transcription factor [Bifidobacteriaceae bacterium]|jgi:DNA-binding response OmpR family regulator|nr:response regulator transcription factor [Bifidobacteriaceae bacterium]
MRILIVEDEKKIADALKKGLENKSYAVDVAYDGQKGLDLALSENYDLLILDRMLPLIDDGLTIAKEVREQGKNVPILILTARDTVPDTVQGLDIGADDYLAKPFVFAEFLARVRALLRRRTEIIGDVIEYAGLSLNTDTFEVKRNGTNIQLSKKEFALLEHLLRNAPQIVPKENLIDNIWSFESDVLPNTLEVFIGYLRQKVDKPFPDQPPLIKTVRGFGYKIDEM